MAFTAETQQLFDRAAALMAQQQFAGALDLLNQVQREARRNVHTACLRATCLSELSRTGEALSLLDTATRLRPNLPGPWLTLGDVLRAAGEHQQALEAYDRAALLAPHNARVHERRARSLIALRRAAEALSACETALSLKPGSPSIRTLHAAMLIENRRHQEAAPRLRALIADHPEAPEAYVNLGVVLNDLGDPQAALTLYQQAVQRDRSLASARVNAAAALLKAGDFSRGWRLYEQRGGYLKDCRAAGIDRPPWLGQTPIAGRTIRVQAELGLGDTLQFCRYLPMLQAAGARVLFASQPPLAALMRTLRPMVELADFDFDTRQTFDEHVRLLSLPLAFGIGEGVIPAADKPYLSADPVRVARWRARLGDHGFRIGVCWKGSDVRNGRAFPLSALAGVASVPCVRLISLQTGPAAQDAPPPGMTLETLGANFDAGPDAFLDAAAVIEHCDLVITTDTSIGHLAGALGRETWIPLNLDCCWRWMLDREDSPWYPRHRLFRQTVMDDWKPVFARMEARLRGRLAWP